MKCVPRDVSYPLTKYDATSRISTAIWSRGGMCASVRYTDGACSSQLSTVAPCNRDLYLDVDAIPFSDHVALLMTVSCPVYSFMIDYDDEWPVSHFTSDDWSEICDDR